MMTKSTYPVRDERYARLLRVAFAASCLFLAVNPLCRASGEGPLQAGVARIDITPSNLSGFVSVWAKPFEGVHDPIFARALVIRDGSGNSAVIVATDLVEIGDTTELRQTIEREDGVPVDHILIAASHDHNAPRSGPPTPGTSSMSGRPYSPPAYTEFVDQQILLAVRQAKAGLQPVRVGVGKGSADLNINRNAYGSPRWGGPDPDGPSDKTVWVVRFESLSGQTIGLLMNYAIHSVVAGPDNALITGDLAGSTERFVERHYDGKAVALWSMGAAGDQNPKYNMSIDGQGKNPDPAKNKQLAYEAMDAEGVLLGAEVIQTANRIKQSTATAHVQGMERVFSCTSYKPPPRPAGSQSGNPNFKPPPPPPPTIPIRLGLIRINDIAITGVSGEIFTKIYWHLEKESPLANTILVTMANDRVGYIGDDAEYFGPFTNPAVERGCAEEGIVNGLVDMIAKTD